MVKFYVGQGQRTVRSRSRSRFQGHSISVVMIFLESTFDDISNGIIAFDIRGKLSDTRGVKVLTN